MSTISVNNTGELVVSCPYEERDIVNVGGGKWDTTIRAWIFAFTAENVEFLIDNLSDPSIDPRIEGMLLAQIERDKNLAKIRAMSKVDHPVRLKVPGLKGSLYNYQKLGVMYALANGTDVLIADEMGLGKTLQAIATALCLKASGKISNALIVVPPSLKYNWQIEIEKWTDEPYVIIDGTPDERVAQWLRDDVFFYVVNYELLLEDLFGGKEYKRKKNETDTQRIARELRIEKAQKRARILISVRERMWNFCAIDECFTGNTLIQTDRGAISIQEIVDGKLDLSVLSCNVSTGETSMRRIVGWFANPLIQRLVKVKHEYGEFICTEDHKVWTSKGYIKAKELGGAYLSILLGSISDKEKGKVIQEEDGVGTSWVESVTFLERGDYDRLGLSYRTSPKVYDLEVEDNHNYFADGVLVSNCHALKSSSSKRTRNVKELRASFRMALTGTPLDGRLEELHSVMEFVCPNLLGTKTKFMQRHADVDCFGNVKKYKRIAEVREKIAPHFIRRLKKDVLKELPDKVYNNRIIELSAQEMKIYNELADNGHTATEDAAAMVSIIRCKQFCNSPHLLASYLEEGECDKKVIQQLKGLKESKLTALREILQEIIIENGHKVLIFSQYAEMVKVLIGVFNDLGLKYLCIWGATPKKERAEYQEKFNSDNTIDVMVGTEAMSTGLNFTSADYVINYDDNWAPAFMSQREDRCHRIGQKNVVTVINFICKNTIEERIRTVLYQKSKITAQALGDDIDEMVLKRLGPKEVAKLL